MYRLCRPNKLVKPNREFRKSPILCVASAVEYELRIKLFRWRAKSRDRIWTMHINVYLELQPVIFIVVVWNHVWRYEQYNVSATVFMEIKNFRRLDSFC